MIDLVLSKYNFWISIILMMIGFYAMIAKKNLIKKLIGFNIFQTAIFLFFITLCPIKDGTTPIITPGFNKYDNPLPQVLILTAIVVAVATTAVALALAVRIYKSFGTLEEEKLSKLGPEDA